MQFRNSTIVALCMVLLGVLIENTRAEEIEIAPYEPMLLVGRDEEVCDAFASAWRSVFRGPTELGEQWLDLKIAYPDSEVFTFPDQPNANGNFGGLYAESSHKALDLDGDGSLEVVHVQGDFIGWRYLETRLYLFDSKAQYEDAKVDSDGTPPDGKFFIPRSWDSNDSGASGFIAYPPSDVVYVFSHKGTYYSTAAPYFEYASKRRVVDLFKLSARDEPETVCSLEISPHKRSLGGFTSTSGFFHALTSIYGDPSVFRCQGTLGWTALPLEDRLVSIFHRPHMMSPGFEQAHSDVTRAEAARELRALAWGLSDPASWSVYRKLKSSSADFIDAMTGYYRSHFAGTKEEARAMAEQSYRFLLDRLFYSRGNDLRSLTGIVREGGALPGLAATTSPESIMKVATERLLEMNATDLEWDAIGVWRDAILAAIYTRQELTPIEVLWAGLEALYRPEDWEGLREHRKDELAAARKIHLSEILLAAIGDPRMLEFALSIGADVDAPSNWFAKTALMYAAQADDQKTARLLLEQGADPNARTAVADNECATLKRDGRTPLMYAAENASPELIELLLNAGAETTAADTEGNTAAWYLERNSGLNDEEKAELLGHLNP